MSRVDMSPLEAGEGLVLAGDCFEQMKRLPANSVHAVVTDPPYNISILENNWDALGAGRDFERWTEQWAVEAFRVLKPGGHALVFGASRMFHRLACGIEDAGFEVRDTLLWIYASAMPHSRDIAKDIDDALGAKRTEVRRTRQVADAREGILGFGRLANKGDYNARREYVEYAPATDQAAEWEGWGSRLKGAYEPIVCARKPLEGSLARNTMRHRTGGLNIAGTATQGPGGAPVAGSTVEGRWPTNTVFSHSPDCVVVEAEDGTSIPKCTEDCPVRELDAQSYEQGGDGLSRFFPVFRYEPKASSKERGSSGMPAGVPRSLHPSVKPVNLMRWLMKLVVPPNGIALDPFLGSGSTMVAGCQEGFIVVGCEREQEYLDLIEARMERSLLPCTVDGREAEGAVG